ncbi:MAG: Phenylalanine-tRNA ligase beta subunit [Candidatus Saccharibacteria bacterium]|nr:Phenylalanine-tRNA ligase beta subunit [Candidatus Saccharibacteria bacterium]
MKISLNAIRFVNEHYGSAGNPAPEGVETIVQKIGAQLGAVEETIPYGERFDGVVVVRVMSCAPHPNADRLRVCTIDDGGITPDVKRDENGHVQVVCGAPNVREGLMVAWLPPGSTVPSTRAADPFVMEARELRGVVSNGMLASPKELTIGDSHDGILELDTDAAPGTPFTKAYNLEGDVVIDMENKMFTHRPDCFGQLGIARELEGIQHRPYKSPEWYRSNPEFPGVETDELKLDVRNEIPGLVPRFTAITMSGVAVKPSPVWLQIALSRVGIRPTNNIVDYTNFFMLETGQPLHAYDYDKVVAQDAGATQATIVVRHPREGEKITLLNGKEIKPREQAIMIATNDKLIGVGGVMGGGDTEIDAQTKNIIIESANFDMYSIRRTAMTHGLFTDAVTRFNKGQSPLQTATVLAKIVDEIRTFADGKVASPVIDDNHLPEDMLERNSVYPAVAVTRQFINARLGFDLSADEMAQLLRNVEFEVNVDGDNLTVRAPFWRTDIAIAEDVVEEVGRLYGFDHLPLELPHRSVSPVEPDKFFAFKSRIRDILVRGGANELLTYNFVHGNLLDKVDQNKEKAYRLSNALSPDLQYYRMSLTPSLLDKVHLNLKAGFDQFALFEINKAHNKIHTEDGNLPKEANLISLVYAANDKVVDPASGAAYYEARKYLDYLTERLGISLVYTPFIQEDDLEEKCPVIQPFDLKRAALIHVKDSNILLGMVGEYKDTVKKSLKLPAHTAGFEIGFEELLEAAEKAGKSYQTIPRFPRVTQDISLRVPGTVAYQALHDVVATQLETSKPRNTIAQVSPLDIYQKDAQEAYKQIAFRISIASYERTLTDQEVNRLLDTIAINAKAELGAERV